MLLNEETKSTNNPVLKLANKLVKYLHATHITQPGWRLNGFHPYNMFSELLLKHLLLFKNKLVVDDPRYMIMIHGMVLHVQRNNIGSINLIFDLNRWLKSHTPMPSAMTTV